jgi:hypothetical protein
MLRGVVLDTSYVCQRQQTIKPANKQTIQTRYMKNLLSILVLVLPFFFLPSMQKLKLM